MVGPGEGALLGLLVWNAVGWVRREGLVTTKTGIEPGVATPALVMEGRVSWNSLEGDGPRISHTPLHRRNRGPSHTVSCAVAHWERRWGRKSLVALGSR